MENKKVSIIVPNFNYSQYLCECLQSCFSQTYPSIEIIVVDDGSTDDSLQKLKNYGDKIIVISHDKNYGYQRAINIGIARSTGDYITILDSDDTLPIYSIDARVAMLETYSDIQAVYSQLTICDEKMNIKCVNEKQFSLAGIKKSGNVGHSMVFRRKLLDNMKIGENQWRDEKWQSNGDLEWMLRISEIAKVIQISEPLYNIRTGHKKPWGISNTWGDAGVIRGSIQYKIINEARIRRISKSLPLLDGMEEVGKFYEWVDTYVRRWGYPNSPVESDPCRSIVSHIIGDSILDVCCGLGHFCHYLQGNSIKYVGVDTSEDLLDEARFYFPDKIFGYGDLFDLSSIPMADTVICMRTIGQDGWNGKYEYGLDFSCKDIKNMDYGLALNQLWSKTEKKLIFTCPLCRPERIEVIKNICKDLSEVSTLNSYSFNDEFEVFILDRKVKE